MQILFEPNHFKLNYEYYLDIITLDQATSIVWTHLSYKK